MKLTALNELNQAIQGNRLEEVTRVLGREPGMRALAFAPGSSRWEWIPTDERARNPVGFLYGGYIAVFVDTILSSAIGTVLGESEFATTADLRLEFVRPAAFAPLRGVGRVVHRGKSVAFVEASVHSAADELLASGHSTWTILRAASA